MLKIFPWPKEDHKEVSSIALSDGIEVEIKSIEKNADIESTGKKLIEQSNSNFVQKECSVAKLEDIICMEKKNSGVQNTSPVLKQSSRLKDLQDDHKKAKSLRNKEKKQKQDKDKNCLNTQKDYNPLKLTNKNYKTLDTYKNCAGVDMWYPT